MVQFDLKIMRSIFNRPCLKKNSVISCSEVLLNNIRMLLLDLIHVQGMLLRKGNLVNELLNDTA